MASLAKRTLSSALKTFAEMHSQYRLLFPDHKISLPLFSEIVSLFAKRMRRQETALSNYFVIEYLGGVAKLNAALADAVSGDHLQHGVLEDV
jgi:hypothetical protein